MQRGKLEIQEVELEGDSGDENVQENNLDDGEKKKKRVLKFTQDDGKKTLEKAENLTLDSFDIQSLVDPLFKQTTQLFEKIMCSNLHSTSDMVLQIDSCIA